MWTPTRSRSQNAIGRAACGAHVLAALHAPDQVETGVRERLLQRVRHLEAHALRQALLGRQRVRALRLPRAPRWAP